MKTRAKIRVNGIVQGVGFRPFCHRTAANLGLKGRVLNLGDAGVEITLEGEKKLIKKFVSQLKNDAPPLAEVKDIDVEWSDFSEEFDEFKIIRSRKGGKKVSSVIPPDVGLCEDCLREMSDSSDRHYRYPFTSCVNCGPRFTIIERLPYDRQRTTMREFPLCKDCRKEYENPLDRRYHAESTSCPQCGPKITLHKPDGQKIEESNPLEKAAQLLDKGKILAIKGIGGFHVATKTTNDQVLGELRERFHRPQQPLAIMSRNIETVRTFAQVSESEEELLTSHRRPIMVLQKKTESPLSELIAPGLDSVGVMLPYSGIHYLLLQHGRDPAYVMTSGNLPGLPMAITNSAAKSELEGLVDYFLLHNRKIENRCDDSVAKLVDGSPVFLRWSRGFVPRPIEIPTSEDGIRVLGLGPESDVSASVLVGDRIFVTQYIGDVDKLETLDYLESASRNLLEFLKINEVDYVAHDLHPNYLTTSLAREMAEKLNAKPIPIQHHHAHLYSLMTDQKIDEFVGIAADGAGYGEDGSIWGGEILTLTQDGFERVGGLARQPMPGGDQATKSPARMIAGILWGEMDTTKIKRVLLDYCRDSLRGEGEAKIILRQLEREINVPETSSCGRVLDAISCLLGVCDRRNYEGEPAIKLEAAARKGDPTRLNIDVDIGKEGGLLTVDTTSILIRALDALKQGVGRRHIAASSQRALSEELATIAIKTAQSKGIKTIGASGGVFYNDAITKWTKMAVEEAGLNFVRHEKVPPGDGGISIGQVFGVTQII